MAQREVSHVAIGMLADEAVLRGGHLAAPVVLQNLRVVEGRQFIPLSISCINLCQFLSGRCRQTSPLSKWGVFKRFVALRRSFVHDFLNPAKDQVGPGGEDHAAALGLDAECEDCPQQPIRRTRRKSRVVKKQLPAMFDATMPIPGRPDWVFALLLESGTSAPCIEATQANFDALLHIVETERGEAADDAPKKQASRRSPRGERGSREYWIESKGRWVTVQYEPAEGDGASKKRRTTTRRPSDSGAVLPLAAREGSEPTSGEEASCQEVRDEAASRHIGDGEASRPIVDAEDACASLFG